MSKKILLTGDSIITRPFLKHQKDNKLSSLIRDVPFAFTNLEVLPIDYVGNHSARSDGAHFGAPSLVIDDLLSAGFNLFSCANNHMLDYGENGLNELINILDEKKMTYSGIGKTLGMAGAPSYLEIDGTVVSLISISSTFFPETAAGESNDYTNGRTGINPLGFEVEYHLTEENFNSVQKIYKDLKLDKIVKEAQDLGFVSKSLMNDDNILDFNDFNHRTSNGINSRFIKSDKNEIVTKLNRDDLHRHIKWIEEAKNRSDICIVSLHAHESKGDRKEVDDYIIHFAHEAIDNGADLVVCHGPHLLRGIELYNGKPIFYSLGNFIGQNDQVRYLPTGSYKRFGVDKNLHPSEVFDFRSEKGKKGFPGVQDYWETIVPICEFDENHNIVNIDIHPVQLSNGPKAHMRGKPEIPSTEIGDSILNNVVKLSSNFGTDIKISDCVGKIQLK